MALASQYVRDGGRRHRVESMCRHQRNAAENGTCQASEFTWPKRTPRSRGAPDGAIHGEQSQRQLTRKGYVEHWPLGPRISECRQNPNQRDCQLCSQPNTRWNPSEGRCQKWHQQGGERRVDHGGPNDVLLNTVKLKLLKSGLRLSRQTSEMGPCFSHALKHGRQDQGHAHRQSTMPGRRQPRIVQSRFCLVRGLRFPPLSPTMLGEALRPWLLAHPATRMANSGSSRRRRLARPSILVDGLQTSSATRHAMG